MKLQTEQILYQWIKILNKIRKIYYITREQHSLKILNSRNLQMLKMAKLQKLSP